MSEQTVKQVIIIRRDLHMRRGKEIAQGAHAAMAWLSRRLEIHQLEEYVGLITLTPAERAWLAGSFTKVVLQVPGLDELMSVHKAAEAAELECHLITDAGVTEFHGTQTVTCLAIGPDYARLVEAVTGELELY